MPAKSQMVVASAAREIQQQTVPSAEHHRTQTKPLPVAGGGEGEGDGGSAGSPSGVVGP